MRDPYYFSSDKRFTPEELAARKREEAAQETLARKRLKWCSLAFQLGMFVLILALWRFPFMLPIRLVVILFHEMSHVIAAYLSGGVVFGIAIDPGGAGATLGIGGVDIFVAFAGYLGCLVIGVGLYLLSAVWEGKETWAVLMALFCVSLLFGWLNGFTVFFGYACIIGMGAGFFVLQDELRVFAVRVIATTCCLFPLIDLTGDLFQDSIEGFNVFGETPGSDMAKVAQMTGLPEPLLIIPWIIAGVVALLWVVSFAAKRDAVMIRAGKGSGK